MDDLRLMRRTGRERTPKGAGVIQRPSTWPLNVRSVQALADVRWAASSCCEKAGLRPPWPPTTQTTSSKESASGVVAGSLERRTTIPIVAPMVLSLFGIDGWLDGWFQLTSLPPCSSGRRRFYGLGQAVRHWRE